MMLFVGSQGDRVIVVNQLGVKELGLYSAVLMLVFYPTAALLRYMHALYVPQIAAARANPQDFRTVSERLGGQTFFLSIVTMAGFALFAPMVVGLLYGHRYEQAPLLIGLIGALQTTRILINWPTTVALATGRSGAVMLSNFFRILAFPGAFAGLWVIGGLTGLVAGFAAGEVTAIAAGIALLNRNTGRPPYAGFGRLSRHVIAAMLLVAWELVVARPDVWNVLTTAGATIGAVVWILWSDWTSIADLAKSCVVGITSLRPGRNRPGRPAAPAARTEGWVDAAAVNSTMNSARIAEEKAIVTGADR
jgi:O-antigen/teichoic acid export membrane protein